MEIPKHPIRVTIGVLTLTIAATMAQALVATAVRRRREIEAAGAMGRIVN